MRIAMVSEHASPLATLGGVDAGGQNVHVAALSAEMVDDGHDVAMTQAACAGDVERLVVAAFVDVAQPLFEVRELHEALEWPAGKSPAAPAARRSSASCS